MAGIFFTLTGKSMNGVLLLRRKVLLFTWTLSIVFIVTSVVRGGKFGGKRGGRSSPFSLQLSLSFESSLLLQDQIRDSALCESFILYELGGFDLR